MDEQNETTKVVGIVHAPDGHECLVIKIDWALWEQLIGKPYPEQLKMLLGMAQDFQKSEGVTEEILQIAENSERKIKHELNKVHADLN